MISCIVKRIVSCYLWIRLHCDKRRETYLSEISTANCCCCSAINIALFLQQEFLHTLLLQDIRDVVSDMLPTVPANQVNCTILF